MENHRETEFFKNLIKRMQNNNGVNLEKKCKTQTNQSEITTMFHVSPERKYLNKNVMTSIEEN